jgi:hypothetical protein
VSVVARVNYEKTHTLYTAQEAFYNLEDGVAFRCSAQYQLYTHGTFDKRPMNAPQPFAAQRACTLVGQNCFILRALVASVRDAQPRRVHEE